MQHDWHDWSQHVVLQRYAKMKKLGEGSFGEVRKTTVSKRLRKHRLPWDTSARSKYCQRGCTLDVEANSHAMPLLLPMGLRVPPYPRPARAEFACADLPRPNATL